MLDKAATTPVGASTPAPHLALTSRLDIGLVQRQVSSRVLLMRARQLLGEGMQHPEEGPGVRQRCLLSVDEAA